MIIYIYNKCKSQIYVNIQYEMQQQYQVLNLHSIIKSQEQKIHELRHELKIANEREQERYKDLVKELHLQSAEKDKLIEYLKLELQKTHSNQLKQAADERDRTDHFRENQRKELIQYKKKCIELEGKLKRSENEYEIKFQELISINLALTQKLQKYEESKQNISIEISKLNYFYKNSIFQIAKRRQTLLWVQKFTEYLQNSQEKEKKTIGNLSEFIKGEVEALRTQIINIVKDIKKGETEVNHHHTRASQEINIILKQIKENIDWAVEQNQKYWINAIRQQKEEEKVKEIQLLKQELQQKKQQNEIQLRKISQQLKFLENQKRSLVLGFQELKNLNQGRQNNYREQIKHLKQTLEELIISGEERDKDFEREIETLSRQISHISSRYYENIQYPLSRINDKYIENVEELKKDLKSIQNSPIIKASFQRFENSLEKYLKLQQSHPILVEDYYIKCCSTLQQIMSHIQRAKKENQQKKQYLLYNSHEQAQVLQWREKLNKSQYENNLTKKHNTKLLQHIQELEKKTTNRGNKTLNSGNSSINPHQRILFLESQNQALKQTLNFQQQSFEEDLQTYRKKILGKLLESNHSIGESQMINSAILQLKDVNDKVCEYIKQGEKQRNSVQECLNVVNTLLVKPLENFDALVRSVIEMGNKSSRFSIDQPINTEISSNRRLKGLNTEEITNYKMILAKRSQNYQSTQKLVSQLLRNLRESQKEARNREKQLEQEKKEKTPEKIKKKDKIMEKKIKQIQNQRLKDKQDFLQKIDKNQQILQSLENKLSRQPSLHASLAKFEFDIDKRISDLISKVKLKVDNKPELGGIKENVIKDLKSKLQEANIQSEGLKKELSLMYQVAIGKNQR